MTARTLILGTSFVGPSAQGYTLRMVELWAKLLRHLNPDIDALVIDSASPTNPTDILAKHDIECFRFDDNIGHLNGLHGRDGWGRAFCAGIEIAIQRNYDALVYMDTDIILAEPVGPIVDKLRRHAIKVAMPLASPYMFAENGLAFYDVAYLAESRFVERYDWLSRTAEKQTPLTIPEVECERLLRDEFFLLPLRGWRDDRNQLTVNNIATAMPYGLDWLTHVKNFAVYERFLEMKGIML